MRKMRQFYEEWKSIAICSPLASKISEERIDAEALLSIQSDLYFFISIPTTPNFSWESGE